MYVLGLGDYASPILGKRRSSFAEVPFISFVCCGAKFLSEVSGVMMQKFLSAASCAPLIFCCVNLIDYVL